MKAFLFAFIASVNEVSQSMLSKQKQSMWLFKTTYSYFALNALIEFLNWRFYLYTAQEKETATLKFSSKRLFWKISRIEEPLFS